MTRKNQLDLGFKIQNLVPSPKHGKDLFKRLHLWIMHPKLADNFLVNVETYSIHGAFGAL